MRIPEEPKLPVSNLIKKFEDEAKSKAAETAKKSAAKKPTPAHLGAEFRQLKNKKVQKIENCDSQEDTKVHKERSVRTVIRLVCKEIENCSDKKTILRENTDGVRALRLFVRDELKKVFSDTTITTNSSEFTSSLLHNLEMNKGKIAGSQQIFKALHESLLKSGIEDKRASELVVQTFFLRAVNSYLIDEGEKTGTLDEAGVLSGVLMKKTSNTEDPTIAAIIKILLGETR